VAASNFDTTRVRLGDLVAAVSGAILFLSLFLHWYSVSVHVAGFSQSKGFSGWTVLSFIDILLFLIAAAAIAVAVLRMANSIPRLAVSPGLVVLGLGVLATLLVLFRIIDIPGDASGFESAAVDIGRSFGIFVALLASLGIAAGGWITWNEEGRPAPSGRGATAPVGTAQPPAGYQQPAATAAPPAAASPGAGPAAAAQPVAAAAPAAAAPADAPPPGGAADWYPDPRGEKRLRYWDGAQWTHHTAD
jgi:hypothetical protein